jgi:hypothetical protein
MVGEHLDPVDETLPPIPTALRLSTHISRAEEERMGVEQELTKQYRDTWDILNSDGLQSLEKGADQQSDASTEHGSQAGLESRSKDLPPPAASVPKAIVAASPSSDARKRAYSTAAISIASNGSSYRAPPLAKVIRRY